MGNLELDPPARNGYPGAGTRTRLTRDSSMCTPRTGGYFGTRVTGDLVYGSPSAEGTRITIAQASCKVWWIFALFYFPFLAECRAFVLGVLWPACFYFFMLPSFATRDFCLVFVVCRYYLFPFPPRLPGRLHLELRSLSCTSIWYNKCPFFHS